MVNITTTHIVYLISIFVIFLFMVFRKDIILPCIASIFAVAMSQTKNVLKSIEILYSSVFVSGKELWQVILIISLIIAMSHALDDIGADVVITKPLLRFLSSPSKTFWIVGIVMMVLSFFLWPSPAVGLIGAVLIGPVLKSGFDELSFASLVTIFGFGAALSGDFFIQGVPSVTAKTLGIPTSKLILSSIPVWGVTSLATIIFFYFVTMKKLKNNRGNKKIYGSNSSEKKIYKESYIISFVAVLFFAIDTFLMYILKIKGNAATALIGGTAIIVLIASTIIQKDFLNKTRDYLKNGFLSGIKTFAPIILISAFFFLGELTTAKEVIGPDAKGYLMDLGIYLSKHIPLNKYTVALMQLLIGILTGLSGSGFSGLPLVGALSKTFAHTLNINSSILASLGEITCIWVGGGTIIPWSVVPVTAVIKVDPDAIVKRNLLPVIIGLTCGYIATVLLL
ncbi:hypothetical protein Thexy_1100 [Thermoanaerobacterium xylanolyticum LX-11]|uniref:Citrate transporter n=1 Tax=Thermoanaerobacterium xylanolyticum (strain ATCC 49914 / DSM 7097 / LX-11) TaxID=858215 RepID=F6BKK1_THEXL|nr:hypothetical protein [Thermoanaerobacterium xylanolyticum]AEF17133.1 hypothetical protein Thexy_1100 [Thermoanaerobacterium xylanolyticum LX-11]